VVVSDTAGPGASATPAAGPVDGGGADYIPLIFGILGAGVLTVGGIAVYQVRKPRISLDPVATPPDPIVVAPGSGEALRSLLDAMTREMHDPRSRCAACTKGRLSTRERIQRGSAERDYEMEQLRLQAAMDSLAGRCRASATSQVIRDGLVDHAEHEMSARWLFRRPFHRSLAVVGQLPQHQFRTGAGLGR
jgi:hypothetical protein